MQGRSIWQWRAPSFPGSILPGHIHRRERTSLKVLKVRHSTPASVRSPEQGDFHGAAAYSPSSIPHPHDGRPELALFDMLHPDQRWSFCDLFRGGSRVRRIGWCSLEDRIGSDGGSEYSHHCKAKLLSFYRPLFPVETGANCLFTSGQWGSFLRVRDRRMVPFVRANAGDHTDAVPITRWRPESIHDKEVIDHRRACSMRRYDGKHRSAVLPFVFREHGDIQEAGGSLTICFGKRYKSKTRCVEPHP